MAYKKWTASDLEYLRSNYQSSYISDIAAKLGRTPGNVRSKASYLGLKLAPGVHSQRLSEKHASQEGESNPNWKGGISRNNYHYKKLQVDRYPERVKARAMVQSALRSGKITRQPCEVCGKLKAHAHHDDYSKPLEVRWLCKKHHDLVHRRSDSTE